jgi:hypothetical protein
MAPDQQPGDPQQVVPMADDQLGTHPMPRQPVQRAIVGLRIERQNRDSPRSASRGLNW